jgi:uncharacterized membrane protein
MDLTAALGIFFRWLHVTTAAVAVGSVFFMRIAVPGALAELAPELREQTRLRLRRRLKMIIHPCILFFLISGIYNAYKAWPGYQATPGFLHIILTHIVLASIVFVLALIILAGSKPPAWAHTAMAINLVLLFLAIAMGSTLKWLRDHPTSSKHKHATTAVALDASAPDAGAR